MRHAAWCALLLLLALAACRPAPSAAPNVILISIDTLRADALGVYGGPVPTPHLDALARDGVLFESALAPAPETAPAHATLFTGRGVLEHGLVANGQPLPAAPQTLAETFRDAGYHTAAFVSSYVLDPRFGWSRGFGVYDAPPRVDLRRARARLLEYGHQRTLLREGLERRAQDTTVVARRWLLDAPEPFFLFVHYFDPHAPYEPPPEYARRVAKLRVDLTDRHVDGLAPAELEAAIRRYHGEVLNVDDAVGELESALRTRRIEARTIVVVVADHGEGLGQHGWLQHASSLHREQIRVPWILHAPGRIARGARLATPVSTRTVAPTVAELAGVPIPRDATGRSLAREVRRGRSVEPRPIFAYHAPRAGSRQGRRESFSVRSERYRYIRYADGRYELYDVAADPRELTNVAAEQPAVAERLGSLLDEHVSAFPPAVRDLGVGEDVERSLEALGYVH